MGATTCAAVLAAADLELTGAVDPSFGGAPVSSLPGLSGLFGSSTVAGDADSLDAASVDVAVDFTRAEAARTNLAWCGANGVHAVVGTTGLTEADYAWARERFAKGPGPNAIIAPNFSIGAVLMMRCAALCAPYFEGVEIIELHHGAKRDAPSGTALATARAMESARAAAGSGALSPDPTETEVLEGARGSATPAGLHVHSVRLPGLVAHQEVLFGSVGETLTIRHDSPDRVSFMAGVLLAVRRVGSLDGLTVGLDGLL